MFDHKGVFVVRNIVQQHPQTTMSTIRHPPYNSEKLCRQTAVGVK